MDFITINAASVLDLRMSAPNWVDYRSSMCASTLVHYASANGLLQFTTTCATSKNSWLQTIQFKEWALLEEDDKALSWVDYYNKYPNVAEQDIKVHCNCPAFLYWGSQYNLTNVYNDTAIYPENRGPTRNKTPKSPWIFPANVICKHLAAVFDTHF